MKKEGEESYKRREKSERKVGRRGGKGERKEFNITRHLGGVGKRNKGKEKKRKK